MRAADADRQAVADRLREAVDEGRLDLHEYDERLQRAYAAKTYGDLDGLLDDLPPVIPAQQSKVAPRPAAATPPAPSQSEDHDRTLAGMWGSWVATSVICTGIWAASSAGDGWHWQGFWPIWVIGPWGAVCLARTLRGFIDPGYRPEDHDARRAHRRDYR
jgi:hypothetical protein